MKLILTFIVTVFSMSAFSAQTITCAEYNKDGSVKKRGASLQLKLAFKGNNYSVNSNKSKAAVTGLWEKDSGYGEEFYGFSANQSDRDAEHAYTTIFFNDQVGEIEYQLQLDERLLKKDFTQVPAKLVFGFDCYCSEEGLSYFTSVQLLCSSKGN